MFEYGLNDCDVSLKLLYLKFPVVASADRSHLPFCLCRFDHSPTHLTVYCFIYRYAYRYTPLLHNFVPVWEVASNIIRTERIVSVQLVGGLL